MRRNDDGGRWMRALMCLIILQSLPAQAFSRGEPPKPEPSDLITEQIERGEIKLAEGDYVVPSDVPTYANQGLEDLRILDAPPATSAVARPPSPLGRTHKRTAPPPAVPLPQAVNERTLAESILRHLIASTNMPAAKRGMQPPVFDIVDARNFNCVVTVQLHIACTDEILKQIVEDGNSIDQNMLAFVLAHELAHIVLKHRDRLGKEEKLRANIGALSTTAGIALLFAKSNYAKSGNTVMITATHGASNALMYSLLGGAYSSHKAQVLLGPAWSRRDEDEADALGLALMAGAGYDPSGGVTFIDRTQESIAEAKQKQSLFEKEMQSSVVGGAALSAILSKGDWKTVAITGLAFGADKLMEYRGDVYHHNAKERHQAMAGLIDRYYKPAVDIALLQAASGKKRVPTEAERLMALAIQHADHERQVRQTFMAKGAAAAAALCGGAALLAGEHEICGVALVLTGKSKEGRALLAPVLKDHRSPPHYFDEIALSLAAAGERGAAMSALDDGSDIYPDGRYYTVRMHILRDLGDDAELKKVEDECQAKANNQNKLACTQLKVAYQQQRTASPSGG